jgi:hypothetical protein
MSQSRKAEERALVITPGNASVKLSKLQQVDLTVRAEQKGGLGSAPGTN